MILWRMDVVRDALNSCQIVHIVAKHFVILVSHVLMDLARPK